MNGLPVDTYYRGYRLSRIEDGLGAYYLIWFGTDLIDEVDTKEWAKDLIDGWLNAP